MVDAPIKGWLHLCIAVFGTALRDLPYHLDPLHQAARAAEIAPPSRNVGVDSELEVMSGASATSVGGGDRGTLELLYVERA